MAFVLEKVSTEDQLRILNDAKNDDEIKFNHFNHAYTRRPERLPETWAIDHEHNYYLIKAPIFRGSGVKGFLFYFYFQQKFYEVETKEMIGETVRLNTSPPPNLLAEIQSTLREAFKVHGYYGDGDPYIGVLKNAQFVEFFEEHK